MNHKSKTKEEYWKEHIANWQNSGKNQRQYCSDSNIATATFYYWKKRLSEYEAPLFVKLPRICSTVNHIELIIPDGIKLIFDQNVQIKTIITIMENICRSIGMK